MAEEKAAAKPAESAAPAAGPAPSQGKPVLFIALLVVNMLFIGGVGAMLFLGQKKKASEPGIEDVIKGEHAAQEVEKNTEGEFVGKLVPLETFLVNLANSRGTKLMKVNMELEVTGEGVLEEIEKRKPQIRDIIIILLSSKSYQQVSAKEGKELLRDEIRDRVNPFLTKGQIKRVYFTEFIYQ